MAPRTRPSQQQQQPSMSSSAGLSTQASERAAADAFLEVNSKRKKLIAMLAQVYENSGESLAKSALDGSVAVLAKHCGAVSDYERAASMAVSSLARLNEDELLSVDVTQLVTRYMQEVGGSDAEGGRPSQSVVAAEKEIRDALQRARRVLEQQGDDELQIEEAVTYTKCPLTKRDLLDPHSAGQCGHVFDGDAIRQFLRDGTKPCPVCKKPLMSSKITPEEKARRDILRQIERTQSQRAATAVDVDVE